MGNPTEFPGGFLEFLNILTGRVIGNPKKGIRI
jgi:hypothetical protein